MKNIVEGIDLLGRGSTRVAAEESSSHLDPSQAEDQRDPYSIGDYAVESREVQADLGLI
jgi:hypothetical protein